MPDVLPHPDHDLLLNFDQADGLPDVVQVQPFRLHDIFVHKPDDADVRHVAEGSAEQDAEGRAAESLTPHTSEGTAEQAAEVHAPQVLEDRPARPIRTPKRNRKVSPPVSPVRRSKRFKKVERYGMEPYF